MASEWFYVVGSSKEGPVDTIELKRLAGTGIIKRETLVWKSGLEEWIRAERIRDLFTAPSTLPPPLPSSQPPPLPKSLPPPLPINSTTIDDPELKLAPTPFTVLAPAPVRNISIPSTGQKSVAGTAPLVGLLTPIWTKFGGKPPIPLWAWITLGGGATVALMIIGLVMLFLFGSASRGNCPDCGGTGAAACYACSGSGRMSSSQCMFCHGYGRGGPCGVCGRCNGTGKLGR